MSFNHHGDAEQSELMKRFVEEAAGLAERKYPKGRIDADDDGALTYAIAFDQRHKVVKIVFSHPTSWVGLGEEQVIELRDRLTEYLMELRGVKAG